ncbi:MAG: hypothetical protein LC667_02180 [Thioalkalivibrio sp.]|nr:hypothetical protein [Thioalkalivibrio sp.]
MQIMGARPHESYVSPIDGTVITSRRDEQRHKAEHGVIQHRDLGPDNGRAHLERMKDNRKKFLSGESPQHRKELRKEMDVVIEKLKQGVPPAKPREGDLA